MSTRVNEPPAAEQTLLPERLAGLLLPLEGFKLLVPVTAVAEVVNVVPDIDVVEDGGLLIGWILWRNQRIPLVSFEAARGSKAPQLMKHSPMVVFNAIGAAKTLGFYAVLLQNLPTPIQVTSLELDESSVEGGLILAEGPVLGESAALPDLDALEKRISAFGN